MTKFKLFHLKNDMLAANFLANFIGVFLITAFMMSAEGHGRHLGIPKPIRGNVRQRTV